MFYRLKYCISKTRYQTLRFIIRIACSVILDQKKRKNARNALYKKYLTPLKIIYVNQENHHLSKAILKQINAVDNEYFITQNTKIMTGGGGLSF